MKKFALFWLILFGFSFNCFGEEKTISQLELELNEKINQSYQKTVDSANSIISNGLSLQSIGLSVISIIFIIVTVFLSVVVYKYFDGIEKINNFISENRRRVEIIKTEIESYPQLFYERIKEEETKDLFDRLKDYPEDINNMFSKLATRKLDEKYFIKLKDNYEKNNISKDPNRFYLEMYLILIFQHFPISLFLEGDLFQKFIDSNVGFRNAHFKEKNDIIVKITEFYLNNDIEKYQDKYLELLRKIKREGLWDELGPIVNNLFKNMNQSALYEKLVSNLK